MSYSHLTTENRVVIETLIREGLSHRRIARRLGCSHSTISAEVRRNSNSHGNYRWYYASKETASRRRIANQRFRVLSTNKDMSNNNSRLTRIVIEGLRKNWSPEQISGRFKRTTGVVIAVQTIYDWIYQSTLDRHTLSIAPG